MSEPVPVGRILDDIFGNWCKVEVESDGRIFWTAPKNIPRLIQVGQTFDLHIPFHGTTVVRLLSRGEA